MADADTLDQWLEANPEVIRQICCRINLREFADLDAAINQLRLKGVTFAAIEFLCRESIQGRRDYEKSCGINMP